MAKTLHKIKKKNYIIFFVITVLSLGYTVFKLNERQKYRDLNERQDIRIEKLYETLAKINERVMDQKRLNEWEEKLKQHENNLKIREEQLSISEENLKERENKLRQREENMGLSFSETQSNDSFE